MSTEKNIEIVMIYGLRIADPFNANTYIVKKNYFKCLILFVSNFVCSPLKI